MARLAKNSPLQGISGTLGGDLIFRQIGSETIVSMKPQYRKKSSLAQKETRGKFREATEYSKAQMKDPVRKEYYRKIAKKLKLPNAYTAAITEYMRGPVIDDVHLEKGKDGNLKVKVRAHKKGFKIKKIQVRIKDKAQNDQLYPASQMGQSQWICKLGIVKETAILTVEVVDELGNYKQHRCRVN